MKEEKGENKQNV